MVASAILTACLAGCTAARAEVAQPVTTTSPPTRTTRSAPTTTEAATTTTAPPATAPTTTTPTTTTQAATTTIAPTTTVGATTSDAPTTTIAGPLATIQPVPDTAATSEGAVALPTLAAAFASSISAGNAAASVSVWRDHVQIFGEAAGTTEGGGRMTSDSPMVLASVSKLITALTVARLAEDGKIDVGAPVPWDRMGITHDPAWDDVTVRELLDHTAGMPKAQASWLNVPGSCAIPLAAALSRPPTATRGKWTYSNGNYCALGLLVEAVTGTGRDKAARSLIFDPIDDTGPHLTTDGLRGKDAPYALGVARLERLGGAGTWLASTDDLAAMLAAVTPADMETLQFPGIMSDQYGWGHTGTVDGAKACAWVIEGGRTVVAAIVSGSRPSTGGGVCDVVVPALATDLGIWADKPVRQPN